MQKGDIVFYKNMKAKIIGMSRKADELRYKLRFYDGFNTIAYNVDPKECRNAERLTIKIDTPMVLTVGASIGIKWFNYSTDSEENSVETVSSG